MITIAIIDYGMGNLHSAESALEHVAERSGLDVNIQITADAKLIKSADRVMFPGVGAIRDCMGEITRLGLDEVVTEVVKSKPVLAVCVGFQALMARSEENDGVECLGLLPGDVKFFGHDLHEDSVNADGLKLKVPHMGWNQVEQLMDHPLWANIPEQSRFYFVHSFYVDMPDDVLVAGKACYGHEFVAAAAKENIFAVQFHPEKSATHGLQLLENFLSWQP